MPCETDTRSARPGWVASRCVLSNAITRGTAASTEMRSRLIVSISREATSRFSKCTSPAKMGGTHSPIICPKMWLKGSV